MPDKPFMTLLTIAIATAVLGFGIHICKLLRQHGLSTFGVVMMAWAALAFANITVMWGIGADFGRANLGQERTGNYYLREGGREMQVSKNVYYGLLIYEDTSEALFIVPVIYFGALIVLRKNGTGSIQSNTDRCKQESRP